MEIIQLREEMENETSNLQILQQLQHQKLANEYKKMKHIKTVSTSTQNNSKARVADSVVLVSICYYSSSTSSRTIVFLITVPVPVLEPKSFQLLFQFQFWNHNLFNYCSSSSSGTLMFQILVLVPVPLLLFCKKYKQKLSNAAMNYHDVYYSTHSWSSSHLNSTLNYHQNHQMQTD